MILTNTLFFRILKVIYKILTFAFTFFKSKEYKEIDDSLKTK